MGKLGMFVCLLFVVVVSVQSANAEECTPGELKQDNCNSCNCIQPGIWICTKINCLEKRAVPAQAETCTDGETTSFDNGCNTCTCTNGLWACTEIFCFSEIIPSSTVSQGEKEN